MSYFIHPHDLTSWLSSAQKANLGKNKVRKDLWSDLMEVVLFTSDEQSIRISRSNYLTIQSFCLTDGKSDQLSDDKLLNFLTTLDSMRSSLNEYNANHPAHLHADDEQKE